MSFVDGLPADLSADLPADLSADLPADSPADLPADSPADLPAEVERRRERSVGGSLPVHTRNTGGPARRSLPVHARNTGGPARRLFGGSFVLCNLFVLSLFTLSSMLLAHTSLLTAPCLTLFRDLRKFLYISKKLEGASEYEKLT